MTHIAKKQAKEQVNNIVDLLVVLKSQSQHLFDRKMMAERDNDSMSSSYYEQKRAQNWEKQVHCTEQIQEIDHNGTIVAAVLQDYYHQKHQATTDNQKQKLDQKIQILTALPGINQIAMQGIQKRAQTTK